MHKSIIAGITAVTLSLGVPAQANGFSEEDLGKLLFGIVAAATVAQAIKNNRAEDTTPYAAQTVTPRHPRGHVTNGQGQNGHVRGGQGYGLSEWRRASILPSQCVKSFRTRNGPVQMLTRACIARNYHQRVSFPQRCERDVMTHRGFRSGWTVQCMRDNGFRISHKR